MSSKPTPASGRSKRVAPPRKAENANGGAANDKLQGIQSVEIGISVLDALVDGGEPLTLGEVARLSGLSLSQARRYLVSLVRCGLATQDQATGRYDLGSRALKVGLAALGRVDAIELASEALRKLAAQIREGGTLAVWGDQGPTIVRWLRFGGIGVTSLGLGMIFPMIMSATGRVFLTYLPPDNTRGQLERELGASRLATADSRRQIDEIRKTVRKEGHAWLKGHLMQNIRGAAAPIFDSQGELVAVLAIAGSDKRSKNGRDPSVDAMVEAARTVSDQLCYRKGSEETRLNPQG
jgi:DNA-binding IclR family transcriptional regulator